MKYRNCIIAILATIATGTGAAAADDELQSGIAVGGKVAANNTTKCAGIDDGVRAGKTLCYT